MPLIRGMETSVLKNPTIVANMRGRQRNVKKAAERIAETELKHHNTKPKDYHESFVTPEPFIRGFTLVGVIGNEADHAIYLERGTRPHVIRPKKPGGVLVFDWPKAGLFPARFKKVSHPGTPSYRILERSLQAAKLPPR